MKIPTNTDGVVQNATSLNNSINLKFTDLCIYIDQNAPKIINPGEYPEIENTIYNYLWLLVKALAIKKRMFNQ